MDVLQRLDMPLKHSQSRQARVQGAKQERYMAGDVRSTRNTAYEGMNLVIRPSRPFAVGQRSAHFDTMFAHYIDLVNDPSRARRKDPDVGNRMRQDLQILGCLNVRKLATIQLRREWRPANDSPESKIVADRFEKWFDQQYRVTETLSNMLDSILDGISIQEMVWELNEEDYSFGIRRMFPCYKDRFVFSKDGRLCLLTRRNVFYGDFVHPWQFVQHVYNPSGGGWSNPTDEGRLYWGQGLEDHIYPNFYFKLVALDFYTRWLQRLSSGVLIARYPYGNKEGATKAMELLEAYQEDEELAYPAGDQWDIDVKEATKAPADVYLAFIEYIDRQMSKAILGSTLIIDQGDVGSQSLGEVHERTTFGRIAEFDRIGLIETMNSLVVPAMGQINNVPKMLWPRFDMPLDETSPATNQILEAFTILQSMGYDITAEMVSEKTGFRKPKPGETLLQVPMAALAAGGDMSQENGADAPLSSMDLSSPEGMDRFRTLAYAAGRDKRKQRYQLSVAGLQTPHSHVVTLDMHGNGCTDSVNGHSHDVRNYHVVPSDNHTHSVLIPNRDMDRVMRMMAGT